jgi:hypothetical protein
MAVLIGPTEPPVGDPPGKPTGPPHPVVLVGGDVGIAGHPAGSEGQGEEGQGEEEDGGGA